MSVSDDFNRDEINLVSSLRFHIKDGIEKISKKLNKK